jgi:hypothetical protein
MDSSRYFCFALFLMDCVSFGVSAPSPAPTTPAAATPAAGASATPNLFGGGNPFAGLNLGGMNNQGVPGGAADPASVFGANPLSADPSNLLSALQNPGVQSMMQQMLSNPEMMQQVIFFF